MLMSKNMSLFKSSEHTFLASARKVYLQEFSKDMLLDVQNETCNQIRCLHGYILLAVSGSGWATVGPGPGKQPRAHGPAWAWPMKNVYISWYRS